MFQKFLTAIRDWINKMIKSSDIKTAIGVDIDISAPMLEALQKWALMYTNDAPWLSNYVKSLNLSASIAGEISRSTTIEMEVDISGSARADYLAEQFEKVVPRLREQIEYANAKGGMVFKPYPSGKEVAVDYVQADMFYPIQFDSSGNMTSAIFLDQIEQGQYWYTRTEYHAFDKVLGLHHIRNDAFQSNSKDVLGRPVALSLVTEWADFEPETTLGGIIAPLFGYYKFPLANAIDTTSQLGVSCYSRVDDLIKQADIQWSDLKWEFASGKRRMYVDDLAFDHDDDGKEYIAEKALYRTINRMDVIGTKHRLFDEWSPEFREASYLSGLNAIFKRIEFNVGLAYGTLSDPDYIEKTATEIKTTKQRTYATIVDTQKALEVALDQLAYAIDVWVTIGKLAPAGSYETTYSFDDSIVADHDTQFTQDLLAQASGDLAKWEFRVRNYGEDEVTAKRMIAEIKAEQPVGLFEE